MKLPQGVTWASLILAVFAWFIDERNAPLITNVLGDHAAVKAIACCTLLAALGRSVLGSTGKLPKGFTVSGLALSAIAVAADTFYAEPLAALFGPQAAIGIATAGAILAGVGASVSGPTKPRP